MSTKTIQFYEFANFRLDSSRKILLRDGLPVALTPKVFDTLEILIENAGLLLEKNELMEKIWRDRFVEESNLTSNIKMLRKALGDDAAQPRFIETVPRRGYRFIHEVTDVIQEEALNNGAADKFPAPLDREPVALPAFKKFLLPVAAVFLSSAVFMFFWYGRTKGMETNAPILSAPFGLEKLSTNGKVFRTVISLDGKNVIYTNGSGGDKQSVWLRQIESSNNVEIIPPSDDLYYGLALSPDGNFLYFNRRPKDATQQDIYRVSIFGGIPQKIISDTEGWMSIAPDGGKISYVRCPRTEEENCSLLIADAINGKNERKLVSRPRPIRIGDNEISPDGRSVVFAVGQSQNQANEFGLSEVDIESGQERELTTEKFFNIRHLAWLPEKNNLLFTASRIPNKNYRIWQFSPATGELQPLTKDSENYAELSLDKEAKHLISTQVRQDFRLFLWSVENPSNGQILADATHAAFAPDGKIIFTSMMTGNDDIWSINADGSNRRQLSNDAADDRTSVVSPDNNWIFFTSNRTGDAQIWRMNADGSNQTQIPTKEGGYSLFVSPDGKWLYYRSALEKMFRRVSTKGGEDESVFDKKIDCDKCFAVSPDGSQFANFDRQGEKKIISIFSLADGRLLRSIARADEKAVELFLEWSKDGKNLVYVLADNDYENNCVWLQPLDGGKPQKIAALSDEGVNSFALAPDGKSFAVAQGGWRHDAVLLKGLR